MTQLPEKIGDIAIDKSHFQLERTHLNIQGEVSYNDWGQFGQVLKHIEGAVHWWIGDWLNYGEKTYGETYAQAMSKTGLPYGTLANDKFVASKIEFSRRREKLSWSHHYEVAALEPAQQDELLDQAEAERLSMRQLRQAVKEARVMKSLEKHSSATLPDDVTLICGDIEEELPKLPDGSVDVIITDPPYPKEYLDLYGILAQESVRVLKDGGSMLVMAGQSYLPDIFALMLPHINYHWIVAYLTPGGQAVQLWQRNVNTFWKPVLWFVKGEYGDKWAGDVVKSDVNDNDKRFHQWGQSESGIRGLVERFSNPGDVILDPFVGAGTTGVVAIALERKFIGIDIDANVVEITRLRISETLSCLSNQKEMDGEMKELAEDIGTGDGIVQP